MSTHVCLNSSKINDCPFGQHTSTEAENKNNLQQMLTFSIHCCVWFFKTFFNFHLNFNLINFCIEISIKWIKVHTSVFAATVDFVQFTGFTLFKVSNYWIRIISRKCSLFLELLPLKTLVLCWAAHPHPLSACFFIFLNFYFADKRKFFGLVSSGGE